MDAFQFDSAVVVGLGRASQACFTSPGDTLEASCRSVSHCIPVPNKDGTIHQPGYYGYDAKQSDKPVPMGKLVVRYLTRKLFLKINYASSIDD